MNAHAFTLSGARLRACASGALHWPERGLVVVSDLHLGRAERMARRGGPLLPPYETDDTLARLAADLAALRPAHVIALGDSFDDRRAAEGLSEPQRARLAALLDGRVWDWVEGNHDPGPLALPGTHRAEVRLGPLTFRHIARPDATAEVSGHYHPKARLALGAARVARACFLIDGARVILPAYGTYTGGLATEAEALAGLMAPDAIAVLTGTRAHAIPMPRRAARRPPTRRISP
ncbi:ligase-associated DNA damage response endonuclease PdeM [Rhodobaculum claviforme]|uniref:Metallophosphoesterase n=1 Tax=Rhodobaculum claviforme TaxID=1549854 RepID=A0A934TM59_9RHOB|nr:ligase-associated DNA damage response endonuclease PdeM [Rhodobaculum claviforme]MBK5928345.1 metallophosphoesterase [Rhodobaculum claviforme]